MGIKFSIVLFFMAALLWTILPSRDAHEPKQKSVLWIWDRESDLTFINSDDYIIAPLMCTLHLQSDGIRIEPRHHQFVAPPSIRTIGVVRIESPRKYDFKLSEDHILQMIMSIAGLQKKYNFNEIQIDFDAARSERAFYRQFLKHLRSRLPEKTTISITALASWFAFDPWWRELPVDEIVFMFYPLKPDEKKLYQKLINDAAFFNTEANVTKFRRRLNISIGLSVQSPLKPGLHHYRVFWFNDARWKENLLGSMSSNSYNY